MADQQKTWRCTVCGYIHVGPRPPDFCPVCGTPGSDFEEYEEPAVIVNAYQEPVLPAMHCEWPLEVNLPQFVRRLGSEELPPLMFAWVSV